MPVISSIRHTVTAPLLPRLRSSVMSKSSLVGRHYAITRTRPIGGKVAPLTLGGRKNSGARSPAPTSREHEQHDPLCLPQRETMGRRGHDLALDSRGHDRSRKAFRRLKAWEK